MLKISLDVEAGTHHFVVPQKVKGSYIEKFKLQHNPENRHKFLKGILLYLMGERVSLYAIEQQRGEGDDMWNSQCANLEGFLDKLELKGCIKPHSSSYDLMTFSQHRKHGLAQYADHQVRGEKLTPIGDFGSRLNYRYGPFVLAGLFDVFCYKNKNLESLVKNGCWQETQQQITALLSPIIEGDKNFVGKRNVLSLKVAKKLVCGLGKLFNPVNSELCTEPNEYTYHHIMDRLESSKLPVKYLKTKASGYTLEKEEQSDAQVEGIEAAIGKLTHNKIAFSYFMWRYLSMYVELHGSDGTISNCTQFGLKCLDYKSKDGLNKINEWLLESTSALTGSPSPDSNTEFQKGVFNITKYGVSTGAPVLRQCYDGVFELYIKAPRDIEQLIKERIAESDRWFLRVGKASLGKLSGAPESIPPSYWDEIEDDKVPT